MLFATQRHMNTKQFTACSVMVDFTISRFWLTVLISVRNRLVAEDADSLSEIQAAARIQLAHENTNHLLLRVNEEIGKEETAPTKRSNWPDLIEVWFVSDNAKA